MKAIKFKGLVLTGVILMAMSLITFGQTSGTPQKSGSTHTKPHSQDSNNQHVTAPENSIYDAGSSAQVRHDRTGSLNPGHANTKGSNSSSGPTGQKQ